MRYSFRFDVLNDKLFHVDFYALQNRADVQISRNLS